MKESSQFHNIVTFCIVVLFLGIAIIGYIGMRKTATVVPAGFF